jgi:hypothetical protein
VILLSAKQNDDMNAREMAKELARRGGRAPARRLSAERRKTIAALGGEARHRSLEAERQVIANFRYLEAVIELQGGLPAVTRMKTFNGPLPGIYPDRP